MGAKIEEERDFEEAREAMLPAAEFATRWFVPREGEGGGVTDDENYGNLLTKLLKQEGGAAVLEAGAPIEASAFELSLSDLSRAKTEAAATRAELEGAAQALRAAAGDVAARIWRLPADEYIAAYQALCAEQPPILLLRALMVRGRTLRANAEHLQAARAANALDENASEMDALRAAILARLETVGSPIPLSGKEESLAAQLRLDGDADEAAAWLLDRADLVGTRLLNRLCRRIAPDG